MIINYNTLKQIQRNERNSPSLSEIPPSFYRDSGYYFREFENTDPSSLDIRLYHNALSCYSEIIERRLEKINRKAYFFSVSAMKPNQSPTIEATEKPRNILKSEYELYKKFVRGYVDFYSEAYEEYVSTKNRKQGGDDI